MSSYEKINKNQIKNKFGTKIVMVDLVFSKTVCIFALQENLRTKFNFKTLII